MLGGIFLSGRKSIKDPGYEHFAGYVNKKKKEFWSWRQSILISIANLEGFIFFSSLKARTYE